jgi:tetratricopeptide (TPR) repeat protein
MPEVDWKAAFEDRLKIVLDELSLAIQWERSSLLVFIYRSEHTKNKVQSYLEKSLRGAGQVVVPYVVDRFHYDIPIELLDYPDRDQAVFFVSGLRWGGGRGYSNAYRALNMHREYLIEGNIKAVFWITKNEVRQLSRFSPDFWAFRHKVVEFLDLPSISDKRSATSTSPLKNLYTTDANDFHMMINSAENLFRLGDIEEAIQILQKALRRYPNEPAIYLRIAEIYIHIERFQAAGRILRKASKENIDQENYWIELQRLKQSARTLPRAIGGFSIHTV